MEKPFLTIDWFTSTNFIDIIIILNAVKMRQMDIDACIFIMFIYIQHFDTKTMHILGEGALNIYHRFAKSLPPLLHGYFANCEIN